MFTIDLLKGQGIPMKTTPQGIAVAAVAALAPMAAAIVLFGFYLSDRVLISVRQQQLAHYEAKTAELSGVVEYQEKLEADRSVQRECLVEVNKLVAKRHQWSGVLATLADSMPESLILTSLEVEERQVKKKVPDEDDPTKMVDVTVPAKTLVMNVREAGGSDTGAVRVLRERLYASEVLAPMLENIVVSQETATFDDRNVISYEIGCLLKSKM